MIINKPFYKNKNGLKAANIPVEYTEDQINEYIKCSKDPIHFIENYVKIVSLDEGVVLFKMYDYQKKFIEILHNNTRVLGMWPRQQGKSITTAAYVAWYVTFNEYKSVVVLANKQTIATEIFGRIQFIIEGLPIWLQQGVVEWNKTSFELENGTICSAAATSPSAIRGKSCVTGDTKVCICEDNGEIYYTEIEEYINNGNKFSQILTEKGFRPFDGFINQGFKDVFEVVTDRTTIRCTLDHQFLNKSGDYVSVNNINPHDELYGSHIVQTITHQGKAFVYDALNVKDTHSYITNGLVSHNCSLLILDEFAFMLPKLADEFIKSVFPTLSSSETAKMAIISTPKGRNHFHKLWSDAENGLNDFIPVAASWQDHPHRDQKWADKQLKEVGSVSFAQEFSCEFAGSSYTLVDGAKLASIPYQIPIYEEETLQVFKKPIENHSYVMSVDVSRGVHQDFTAFTMIDVTQTPYEVVVVFKDNSISTMELPHLLYNTARQYNNAYMLIEINDLGEEVSNTIWYDYEYENVYFTYKDRLSLLRGFPGVRTTAKVKSLGCSTLKELVEKDQIILNSYKIIEELGLFVLNKKSYASDNPTINDDLCTTLWLFAWLSCQSEFQDIINISLRNILTEKKQEYIDNNMTPFGFFDDGSHSFSNTRATPRIPLIDNNYQLSNDQIELLRS